MQPIDLPILRTLFHTPIQQRQSLQTAFERSPQIIVHLADDLILSLLPHGAEMLSYLYQ